MRKALILAACILCSCFSYAQTVQVSPANKTIAITADDSVSVDADIAIVSIGCQTYALTHNEAYETNLRLAEKLIKSLTESGLKSNLIHSGKLLVTETEPEEHWSPEQKRQRKYFARQTWRITVPAADAQKLVDTAMQNGANDLDAVEWAYSNPPELQAKAGAAALAKARAIADQMAKGLGAKITSLIYASNKAAEVEDFPVFRTMVTRNASSGITLMKVVPGRPSLQLFPDKVSQSATVHAVFAIE